MVFSRGIDVGGHRNASEVDRLPAHGQRIGLAQAIVEVHVADVVEIHRSGEIRRITVPVKKVERRRRPAFEIVADDVVPDQLVGAKACKGAGELSAEDAAPGTQHRLARIQRLARYVDADVARIGEVEHGCEQSRARDRRFTPGGKQRERARELRAPDTESHRIDGLARGDLSSNIDRRQHALLEIVIPSERAERLRNVPPRNHEHGVALVYGEFDEGIFRAEVEDVVLVDARRDDHKRPLVHLRRRCIVLNELDQLVAEHHVAGRDRQIAAHFERRFVGHGDAAATSVGEQVRKPLGKRCTPGLERELERLRIGGQKIGRRHRVDILMSEKRQALFRARIGLGEVDELAHIPRVQQVSFFQQGKERLFAPFPGRKTPIPVLGFARAVKVSGCDPRPQLFELAVVAVGEIGSGGGIDPGRRHRRQRQRGVAERPGMPRGQARDARPPLGPLPGRLLPALRQLRPIVRGDSACARCLFLRVLFFHSAVGCDRIICRFA